MKKIKQNSNGLKEMRFPLFALFFLCHAVASGQQLFVQAYPNDVYKGANQNWAMDQDKEGVIYFANNDGVLRYDGASWELMPLPDKDFVYSLAVDLDGKIYVGSKNDLGYFQKDHAGRYQYQSLAPKLPESYRKNIESIEYIKVCQNAVFFTDPENIYVYSNEKFSVLNIQNRGPIVLQDHLYLVMVNGLYEYKNKSFQPADFNKELEKLKIRWITEYTGNNFLILDNENKIWVLDPLAPLNKSLHPSSESLHARLKGLPIVRMAALDNGDIAIILKNEVIVVGKNGELLYSLPKHQFEDDIRDGFAYEDRQHNLWLNLNSLILQVITSSPLSFYDKQNGIKGTILSLGKKDQHQYIGTTYGVFYKESKTSFTLLPGTEGFAWNFYNVNEKLYIAHGSGVLELQGKKIARVIDHPHIHALCELRRQQDRMIMGTYDGIWLLEKKADGWHKNKIRGFEEETRFIQEDAEGNIWVSHYNKGIFKLRLNQPMDSVISKTFYDHDKGLPSNLNNRIYRLKNGKIIMATTDGFYSYSKTKDRFEAEERYNQALGKRFCIYTMAEGPEGNLYFWGAVPQDKETAGMLIQQPDSTFKLLLTPFNKIAVPTRDLRVDVDAPVLVANPEEILIGYNKKLIGYNPSKNTFYDEPFQVSIKSIAAKDSLIFIDNKEHPRLKLPFAKNNLQFEFLSSFYENPEKVEYQYKLNGFENAWSGWAQSREAFFTNLPEGNYTFLVRAKNLYGKISEPASFSFYIAPPWYRTWWAYSSYMILFGLISYGIVVLNTRRIRLQKIELQRKVDEKTRELKERNDEVLAQNEEITAMNEEVNLKNQQISEQAKKLEISNATKDKLFSIISHDLRGPIGQVHEILKLIELNFVSEEELKTVLPGLRENIRHTVSLTENLLYWAKNQMDGIQRSPTSFDIRNVVDENFQLLKPFAERKNIQMINAVDVHLPVFADSDMIRLVLRNLINNAIKFTNNDGKITTGYEARQNATTIFVEDTGMGLSKEEISQIFGNKHFTKYGTAGEKGAGLGLGLCIEFIETNGGTLTVASEPGKGSRFSFTLKNSE